MDNWEERAAEAERLAPEAGSADMDARLLIFLLDHANTAVSTAAADALLSRNDVPGLRLYALAFGQAAEDTRNKLSDCLYDELGERWGQVESMLPRLSDDADEGVRHGVEVLQERMTVQSKRDRR